jgi:hypothetical protein
MHIVAHTIIFIACLIGALEISRSFVALIHLQWKTRITAKVFFVTCGLTHVGMALDKSNAVFFTLSDYLQAIALVGFLALLVRDLLRALRRVQMAFQAIHSKYGKDGDRMIATITLALQQGHREISHGRS